MSRVDFYVLASAGERSRQLFACRLAEKAYRLKHTVHILADDRQSAKQIDDLLWTFRDGSFVPHELVDDGGTVRPAPVSIGTDSTPPGDCDLLINLSHSLPAAAGSYPRVAEIVTADEEAKSQSRQRFVDYRNQGHTLDTHNL